MATKKQTKKAPARKVADEKAPVYKKWWFWAIIAAVVVIGGGGTIAEKMNGGDNSSPSSSSSSSKEEREKAKAEREAEKAAQAAKEEAERQEKIANAGTIDYTELFRNADSHKGKYVRFTGEVLQTDSSNSYCRVATKQSTYSESYYENVVYLTPCSVDGTKFLENDVIEFVGEADGNYSYRTVLGSTTELPKLKGAKITLIKHLE